MVTIEEARVAIRNASSYPALVKAGKRFYQDLYGPDKEYSSERWSQGQYDEKPELLLVMHSSVMNRKSARCQTMLRLANEIFTETKLPRRPQGMFRGQDGLDTSKLKREVEHAS